VEAEGGRRVDKGKRGEAGENKKIGFKDSSSKFEKSKKSPHRGRERRSGRGARERAASTRTSQRQKRKEVSRSMEGGGGTKRVKQAARNMGQRKCLNNRKGRPSKRLKVS